MKSRLTDGMAEIAGGTFRMGSDVHSPEAPWGGTVQRLSP